MSTTYIKDLYKKYYIPENEVQTRINNTAEFSCYLTQHLEKLDLVYDWMLNLYFNGLDENAQIIMFDEDVKRMAKNGYKVIPLVFHEAIGSIADNSPLGFVLDVWDPSSTVCLDQQEKDYVTELLEKTKIKCEDYAFLDMDWDYFFENCWKTVLHTAFEFYYGTSYQLAVDNPINQKINKILKSEGLELTYIKELSPKQKLSCIGIDMSCVWPKVPAKDLVINLTENDLK